MQPKARMTFRFDGTAPAGKRTEPQQLQPNAAGERAARDDAVYSAPKQVGRGAPEKAMQTASGAADYDDWTSPYQEDIQALEEVIRGADQAPVSGFSRRTEDAGSGSRPRSQTGTITPLPLLRQSPSSASVTKQPKVEAVKEASAYMKPAPVAALNPATEKTVSQAERPVNPKLNEQASVLDTRSVVPTYDAADKYGWLNKPESKPPERPFPHPESARRNDPEEVRYADDEVSDENSAYDLPDEPDRGWISHDRYNRREGPSWLRVLVTVIGAIATGGLFGYLLLTLFTGEPIFPKIGTSNNGAIPAAAQPYPNSVSSASASVGQESPLANGSAAKGQSDQGSGQQAIAGQTTAVPKLSLFVLQYGVFKTEASMNEAAQQLRDKGIAAATDSAGGYRVYAGVAPSKSEADALVSSLAGTEVYVKSLEGAELRLPQSDQSAEYAAYIKASVALLGKIAGFTAAELSGESAASGNDIQSIRTAHQVWLEKSKLADGWDGTAKQTAKAEIEQLNAAVTALNKYSDTPSDSLLWKVQSDAMNAALADLRLRSAVQAGN